MHRVVTAVLAAALVLVPSAASGEPAPRPIPKKGSDASWPNCPKGMGIPSRKTLGLPMPKKHARFVILGMTNGPGFYPNPCLPKQVKWAKKRGIYVGTYAMTTFPKPKQLKRYGSDGPWAPTTDRKRLKNAGYAQALFNLETMRAAGLESKFMWVDVEPYPVAPWTSSRSRNRAVLTGVLRGYREAGLELGFYTSPGPWRDIIGKKRYGLPEWRTAGGPPWSQTNYSSARRMCKVSSVQGGQILIAQWWDLKRDYDLLCPAARDQEVVDRMFTWVSEDSA